MSKKLNNRGMTLLEVMISMAISFIIILMIISFMNGSLRVFQKTNNTVNLQMEAQTAINRLVDLAMEARNIIKSSTKERYLIQTNRQNYALIYENNELFLVELSSTADYETIALNTDFSKSDSLLAQYVTEITIENTTPGVNNVKTITIKMRLGNEDYNISKNVKLRNYGTPTPTPIPGP